MSHRHGAATSLTGALRRLRDPLLLFVAPVAFAVLSIVFGYMHPFSIGFDFRGTLWEPARALLDGGAVYPEPTREALLSGNPTVYPPTFIVAVVPLALLPVALAVWLWFALLGACVLAALWILGVRDWRCHVLCLTSPVTVYGLAYGNLTIVMVLLLALVWRFADRARIAGLVLGIAVTAKLFVWPLVVWLVLTRRFLAAVWAIGTAVVLVFGAWAVIGFEGLRSYPALLDVVQDVYAIRSYSVSTVAAALGAPVSWAVAVAVLAGIVCITAAGWIVRRADGDRRAFAVLVAACVLASPIVWPHYAALLFVPIAVTWPRLAPIWFFGYASWLLRALSPPLAARPGEAWNHAPVLWYALGLTVVVSGVGVALAVAVRGPRRAVVVVGGRPTGVVTSRVSA